MNKLKKFRVYDITWDREEGFHRYLPSEVICAADDEYGAVLSVNAQDPRRSIRSCLVEELEDADDEPSDETRQKFRVYDIEWDTDGEDVDGLPSEIICYADNEDAAVDAASDETGWCISSCSVEAC